MKKKWIALGTALVMTMALVVPVMAVEKEAARPRPDYTIVMDGEEQSFRTAFGEEIFPLLYNGSIYLPLRAIGQLMGMTVVWDNTSRTVTLTSEGLTGADKSVQAEGDVIAAAEAKGVALNHAGLKESEVRKLTVEKDFDHGILHYDVEFEKGHMEYEYEIHAETGGILKAEKDFDK